MTMHYRRPRALIPGDTVAVVSPSWGGPQAFPHIHDQGVAVLRGWGLRVREYPSTRMADRGAKYASFHVIRNTTRNPAVLVECGFVSNPTERARMLTGEFRALIAEGVAQGILAYKKAR